MNDSVSNEHHKSISVEIEPSIVSGNITSDDNGKVSQEPASSKGTLNYFFSLA